MYRVKAFNTATESENRIHDDAVAARLGFRGGLVPGVDVYAYATRPIVERWGRDWLEHGRARARFLAPVYDGEEVAVVSTPREEGLGVEVRGPDGSLRAVVEAALPATAPPLDPASYASVPLPPEPPPAAAETLPVGAVLGSFESRFRLERAGEYLDDVRETLPIYRQQGIAHPGFLLRHANWVLAANVKLGPWIHVGSDVSHFGVATDGERLSTRGRVAAVYEKKGHRFVDLDLLIVGDGERPLCTIFHTAIYQPRGL